jgi:histidinol phosphatase-like PHP family hydrolase
MKKRKVEAFNNDNVRIIAHIDLDCFYVQVERSVNLDLKNKPVGVVQCMTACLNFVIVIEAHSF